MFGTNIPRDIDEAISVDTKNENTLWYDALIKDIFEVEIDVKILGDHDNIPVGYTKTSQQLIWDVEMGFTCKTRWIKMVITPLIWTTQNMIAL